MKYLKEIDYSHPQFGNFYDELPLWSAPFGLLLLDKVPIKKGITILDIGAGTGFLTIELAQRCGPETKVIAVDPWKAGMIRLQRKLSYLGLQNVTLLEQNVEDIKLPEESIDLIISNLGINNFENQNEVLNKLFQIAKTNADLFLTTNLNGHMKEFYEVFRETLLELGQENRIKYLDEHIEKRGTIDSVSKLLENTGFKILSVKTRSFKLKFIDGSALLNHYFIRLAFIQEWKSIPSKSMINQTFSRLEYNLSKLVLKKGELIVTVPIALFEAKK